jgi:hypothetical protein
VQAAFVVTHHSATVCSKDAIRLQRGSIGEFEFRLLSAVSVFIGENFEKSLLAKYRHKHRVCRVEIGQHDLANNCLMARSYDESPGL